MTEDASKPGTGIVAYDPTSSITLAPAAWQLANRIADTDFVPKALRGKPEAVMACILAGHEAGISPLQSLSKIHIIEGRAAMSAELMRALVLRQGHEIWYDDVTNTRVTASGKRKGSSRTTSITWTMDDAKRAGLDGKQVWRSHPRRMLTARATSELCRAIFADVLAGISYAVEELEDLGGADPTDVLDLGPPEVVEPTSAPAPTGTTMQANATAAAPARPVRTEQMSPPPRGEVPPLPGEEDIVDADIVEPDPAPPAGIERPPLDATIPDFVDPDPAPNTGATYTPEQVIAMKLQRFGVTRREDRLRAISVIVEREISSSKDLSIPEISLVMKTLDGLPEGATLIPADVESTGGAPEDPPVAPPAAAQTEDEAPSSPGETSSPPATRPRFTDPETWNADQWRTFLTARRVKVSEALVEARKLAAGVSIGTLDEVAGKGIAQDLVGFVEDLSIERGAK